MNKILAWAVNALLNGEKNLPDDENFRRALKLAGLPDEELHDNSIEFGKSSLESIFTKVELDLTDSTGTKKKWIKWQVLDPKVMPYPQDNEGGPLQITIMETEKVDAIHSDETIALAFLEKYGTYLSISLQKPYLTFYDCIKNAAAIYTCLEKNNGQHNFLLVGGDLSGIQNYIFNLSESHSKGVAKMLRARSFYLGLFTQVARHHILHSLGLPLYCTIIDAGGRFILLVPASEGSSEKLENLRTEINEFCLDKFNGELALNLSFDVNLTEKDFSTEILPKKIEALNCSLENKKNQAFHQNLVDANWQPKKFVFSTNYTQYENGLCEASGKLPREMEGDLSKECHDNIKIGQHLVRKTLLGFKKIDPAEKNEITEDIVEFPFASRKYLVHFLDKVTDTSNDFYLLEHLRGEFSSEYVPKYFADYVPRFSNIKVEDNKFYPFEKYPTFSIPIKVEQESDIPNNGDIVDFSTLACAGLEELETEQTNGNSNKFIGSDLLGVIKADVDRMGQVFSSGIKKIFSLTTFAALSHELNLFFSAYLPKIQEKDFKWIYTVYAGGDDLFLLGEWQEAIKLAQRLYEEFKKIAGENPHLTLSSAVYVMQPRHPIRLAAEKAEELLKSAKDNERDSMGLFGIVVKQDKIPDLMEMAEFLDEKRKLPDTQSKINSGFLHRLLQYQRLAMTYLDENKIPGLMYGSRLSYDMGRNLIERDKNDSQIIKKGKDEWEKLKDLTNITNVREMRLMRFPISWAILRNRKL